MKPSTFLAMFKISNEIIILFISNYNQMMKQTPELSGLVPMHDTCEAYGHDMTRK